MLKEIFILTIAVIFIALTAQAILTKSNKNSALPMTTIINKLQASGYGIIRRIEYERGIYQAETINAQGMDVRLRINAKTGEVIKPDLNSVRISMLDAIQKVEAAGYKQIYKIKSEADRYKIKGIDHNGKKVDLKVDAKTGVISKEWF